jgi:hypothetical protein
VYTSPMEPTIHSVIQHSGMLQRQTAESLLVIQH